MRFPFLAALPLLVAAAPMPPVPQKPLTIDRIFASPALSGPAPRGVKLSPDGRLATLLRPRADERERYDLWAIDTATGQSRMLVDSKAIGAGGEISEAEKMRRERARVGGTKGIVDYGWAPDGRSIFVPIDGDLYLAALDGTVRRLTDTPQTEIDAHVSQGGRFASFVRDQNLFAIDLAAGTERQLTRDGGGTVTCGTAEFVAQEELDRFTGHWWAPGDKSVAVECYDEAKVKTVTRAAIGADGIKVFEQRYPAAGTPNVAVSLWVVAPDGSGRVKVDLGTDPDIYLARVDWAKDGRTLYVQRLARDQQRLDMLAVDPATGRSTLLFSETAKTWVNVTDDLRPLHDGSLIWGSARSGFMHLYRFAAGQWTALTSGPWMVQRLVGVDEAKGEAYFLANRDGTIEQQLYAVSYLKPGEPRLLTERGYWNDAVMDAAGRRLLITRSSPAQPPQVYLADGTGTRLGWVEENRLDAAHPLAPYLAAHVVPSYSTLKAADGSVLHYALSTPKLAAGRRYPVFVQVYNGPNIGRQVTMAWGGRDALIRDYLVAKGWIVFSIDGRGSPDRGRAFEDQIFHAMGTVEVADQLAGVRWLKTRPFVDPARVAVYGWSYGGYMALKLLEKAPAGTFAAGVVGAPVTQWGLYDTAYTERYLGNPAIDPKPYAAADALPYATDIDVPFLLMHGLADDNVVFENSSALIAKLQAADKPFEMMLYPGATHSISGAGRQAHVWHTIEDFLDAHVLAPAN
jgi:dipeptidyl-peptidase-4